MIGKLIVAVLLVITGIALVFVVGAGQDVVERSDDTMEYHMSPTPVVHKTEQVIYEYNAYPLLQRDRISHGDSDDDDDEPEEPLPPNNQPRKVRPEDSFSSPRRPSESFTSN